MKTLKFSLVLAIIFACFTFVACDPINPPDPPDPPVKVDTVIVKVNFDLPNELVASEMFLFIKNPIFTDGSLRKLSLENVRTISHVFTGKEATALIGETVIIVASVQGRMNNYAPSISCTDTEAYRSMVLKKGLNEITLHFKLE